MTAIYEIPHVGREPGMGYFYFGVGKEQDKNDYNRLSVFGQQSKYTFCKCILFLLKQLKA